MSTATLADPKTAVQDILKKVSSIATLPEVTAKIIATVEDPKSTPAVLHKIISHDPALVSRILKVVNSAFYGLPGQIASVERAIVLLGLNAVKNISVAASLGQLFRGVKLCEGFSARDLWTHCIAVGVSARELARQMRIPLADEAFLAGLIHDIGLLVSLQVAPEKLREVCERAKAEGANFCDLERELTGLDHQQLGAALCEHWKFPRSCQLVAGYHHRPTTLDENNRLLVTLTYVADTICCAGGHGFNLTAMNQKLEDAGLLGIGLDMSLVEQTRNNLPELVSTASGLFS
jgi:putative nucleotidyltransferase with HDIG domain